MDGVLPARAPPRGAPSARGAAVGAAADGGPRRHGRTIVVALASVAVVLIVATWGMSGGDSVAPPPHGGKERTGTTHDDVMSRVVTWHGDAAPPAPEDESLPPYTPAVDAARNPLAADATCDCAWRREGVGTAPCGGGVTGGGSGAGGGGAGGGGAGASGGGSAAASADGSDSSARSFGNVAAGTTTAAFVARYVCGGKPALLGGCLGGGGGGDAVEAADAAEALLAASGDLLVKSRTALQRPSGAVTFDTVKIQLADFVADLRAGDQPGTGDDASRDVTVSGAALRASRADAAAGQAAAAATAHAVGAKADGLWGCAAAPDFDWGVDFNAVWIATSGMLMPERKWDGPMGRFFVGVAGAEVSLSARKNVAGTGAMAVNLAQGDVAFVPKDYLVRLSCDPSGGGRDCVLAIV